MGMSLMARKSGWNEPNLAPTEARRQHYVPESYLRAFLGPDGKVRVIDLMEGREYRTSPDNAAVESGYYDIKTEIGTLSAESWLARIESRAGPVIRKLTDDPSTITTLPDEEEMRLARFLAALRFRGPWFRKLSGSLDRQVVGFSKKIAKGYLFNTEAADKAEAIWDEWSKKPDEWWLASEEPVQQAQTTAGLLSEVQGFANLLRAMPWRAGLTSEPIYASDNPVSGFVGRPRFPHTGPAFADLNYFVPMSPTVLLKIMPLETQERDSPLRPRGGRDARAFSIWETAFARDVVTSEANRFLYGEGRILPRQHAAEFFNRFALSLLPLTVQAELNELERTLELQRNLRRHWRNE